MFNNFIKKYSLQKTLRFELKPVGETADYIEDFKSEYLKDTVLKDEQRAKDYQEIKTLIDDYHREYIEECLREPVDKKTGEILDFTQDLEDAFSYYQKLKENPTENRVGWEKEQESLRKKLVTSFVGNDGLFKKEFITRDLPEWLQKKGLWGEYKDTVENFKKFTTYFSGFHENRKNMYTAEAQSTAIANRLMNDNLPKFFNNYLAYQTIKEKHPDLVFRLDDALLQAAGVEHLDEAFQPRYFSRLFAQSGITAFNELIGGRTTENGEKIQGLNEQINLYRQQNPEKAKGFPRFMPLFKQILSDRETHSFLPDAFENDKELLQALRDYVDAATSEEGMISQLNKAMNQFVTADLKRVYIKSAALTSLSQELFHFFGVISDAIAWYAEKRLSPKKAQESFLKQEVYAIEELNQAVVGYIDQLEDQSELQQLLVDLPDPQKPVSSFILTHWQKSQEPLQAVIAKVEPLFELEELSKNKRAPKHDKDQGGEGFQQVDAIKNMLDAFMEVSHAIKPLYLVKGRKAIDMPDVDTGFYADFAEAYSAYEQVTVSLYNKTRNHLSKKPFSKDKIKINFDAPTLLNGWDLNKESDNKSIILRKDGNFYLAIMHPKHTKVFDCYSASEAAGKCYEKMNYKLLSGANKMLPKVFFSKKGIETFSPPQEILDLYKNNEHKKGATFKLESCHKLIDFFKRNIPKYKVHPTDNFGWDVFGFHFSPTSSYGDLSGFYREVEAQGYKLWFSDVSEAYINKCVEEGKLFLFQIYNKDFSPNSTGKPNLHTLYWKGLFEPENLKDVVLKLNGEAEIFYRKHSIKHEDKTIHRAKDPIANKNADNPKKQSVFDYDIIKDKRYTQDKFFFHVPISLNFKSQGVVRFNDKINGLLAAQDDVHVIGIDRGERHLLYYTVVNGKGEVVEQGSLNQVATDQGYVVDYQQKLHAKEKERDQARKNWSTIENIKELKAGYLSQVVHKLAQLIVKHNAIVCLEDLNFGFKRGRFKVEKQVYQKFEKALIDKLNYLVFKERGATQAGGYLNAYQLAAPFESFEKLGKQTGILYYVRSDYTSKIDPATGFVDFLKPKYESMAKSKVFFESFERIQWNQAKGYFEFEFDYKKMCPSRKFGDYRTRWVVCTFGDTRYQNRRNKSSGQWETETIDVTAQLKALFAAYGITYNQEDNIKDAIAAVKYTKFYKQLYWLLRLTLSLRHSVTGTDEDFILSPVADENGVFFDSRKATDKQPKDADANGAYHIALKGLWNLQQIRQHDWNVEKPKKLNLAMKNEEWFGFAQKKKFRA